MIKISCIALSTLLLCSNAFGEEPKTALTGEAGGWIELSDNELGQLDYLMAGEVRIEGSVKISQCVSLKGRINTGDSFNSEDFTTGIGHEEASLDINLRHLYVDIQCVGSLLNVEVGALPNDDDTRIGSLGISSNGWVDGVRVSRVSEDGRSIWVFTMGSVEDFKNPDVFTRNRNSINEITVGHKRAIGERTDVGAVVAHYNDEYFTRLVLEHSMKEMISWLDMISVEGIARDTDFAGYHVRAKVKLGGWDVNLIHTHVDQNLNDENKYSLLIKDFYGFGDNVYFAASKELTASLSIFSRGRLGDSGPRFELGMRKKF